MRGWGGYGTKKVIAMGFAPALISFRKVTEDKETSGVEGGEASLWLFDTHDLIRSLIL